MNAVFTITYLVWGLSEVLINRLLRSKASDKSGMDKNSLGLIWLGVLIGIGLAVFISMKYSFPISDNYSVKYIGLAIIVSGIILRLIIIKSLGAFFTADVTIRQDHKLKTNGFYKFVRHPSYSASLLSFIGFGISLNNWISLLIILVVVLIVFMNRIKTEERALIGFFGEDYVAYAKSTKTLIPYIY